jgi:tetratricopeptide (TPR) repeat protein
MSEHKMTCINCGDTKWKNVDEYRLKKAGMAICESCGFVSYPDKWQSYDAIKKHYRGSYRQPPTSNNLYTGQRKLHFHNKFLSTVFDKWQKEGNDSPQIFEVGAAYGMVLDWLKNKYPKASVTGTEWTTSYKRVCKHEFDIDLVDDFDDTKKHDLIISYKVAEHQLDVDKELRKYALSLSEKGVLYISVPTWFDSMNNFGLGGFDLEYYYDPNHINVWTREIFENILARAGLKVIQKDYVIYDSTYLCVRDDSLMNTPVHHELVADIEIRMKNIKSAFDFMNDSNYDEAIKTYPDYPTAWITKAEFIRSKLFKEYSEKNWPQIKDYIEAMLKACPTSVDCVVTAADLCMRAERWQDAIKFAELGLSLKPENPSNLSQLINVMREMALRSDDKKVKEHYFKQARDIARHLRIVSAQHDREALDMIYTFDAQLSFEGDGAKQ